MDISTNDATSNSQSITKKYKVSRNDFESMKSKLIEHKDFIFWSNQDGTFEYFSHELPILNAPSKDDLTSFPQIILMPFEANYARDWAFTCQNLWLKSQHEYGLYTNPQTEPQAIDFLRVPQHDLELSGTYQEYQFADLEQDYQQWQDRFNRAIGFIKNNELKKIVLSRTLKIKKPASYLETIERLIAKDPGNHFKFILKQNDLIFLSLTPEKLFSLQDKHIVTESIAGTIWDDQCEYDDKLASEHNCVKDFISSQLEKISNEGPIVSPAKKVEYAHVEHFKSVIQTSISNNVGEDQIINSLHTTPAVSGWPVSQAKTILMKHFNERRGAYAGSFGIITQKRTELCVGIRSIFADRDHLYVTAGAGLVKDSQCDLEFNEINQKLLAILSKLE